VSNRGLRVSSLGLAILVLGAACSSGSSGANGATGGSTSTEAAPPSTAPGTTAPGSPTSASTTPGGSASSSTTIPPGYAPLAALMLTSVPRGLALAPDAIADTGATNLAKAIQDAVASNAGDVLRSAGFVVGYQRSWADADQAQHDDIFLYKFASAAGASKYVTGRVAELESVNSQLSISTFPVLIAGAVGLHSQSATSSFGVVVFPKGVYVVEAVSTDASTQDQSSNAVALANAQLQRLP